jgi:hypothetical protein
MSRSARGLTIALIASIGFCIAPLAASAEVVSGQPDESIQQADPINQGTTYAGAFDDSSYDDVDYLAFQVSQPGQTLEFTVANTTQPCIDPNDAGCPVYATLMDSSDQQVGGDASAAGTIATSADTEVFDWTFAAPGTYYLLMESNGDESPGNPSYSVKFGAPAAATGGSGPAGSGAGSGPTGAPAPIIKSLTVSPRQRGTVVRGRVVLGRPVASLFATLFAPGQRPRFVGRLGEYNLAAGFHQLAIRLTPGYRTRLKRRHHLSLLLRLTVSTASGQHATLASQLRLKG